MNHMIKRVLGFLIYLTFAAQFCVGQELTRAAAFPGAEGFGKYVTGGRGGRVIVVTNLNDSGPGSLREAVKKKEPRIITFAVSGTIALESDLSISYGDMTIAGQSAPGDGICVKNYPVKVSASNVIIRFMRFRLGDERKVQDDAISGTRQKDIIIDHCSMSWSVDECASFYWNENFTMQWCMISESLNASVHEKGAHGYGGIWGGKKATFHHNLIASHNSRLPRFSGSSTTPNGPDELVDFRNNVIYNWVSNNTYGGEKGRYNMIGNYYKPGPATPSKKSGWIVNPSSPLGQFFITNNILFGNAKVTKDNWAGGVKANSLDSVRVKVPFEVEPIDQQSPERAYELVLRYAGASLKRDAVDTRIAEEVRSGKSARGKNSDGIIDTQTQAGGWPELKSLPAAADEDHDGMPDAWEVSNKLDPKDATDASAYVLSKSFTNVEVYLNGLVNYHER
jgi:pectate lyase